VFVCMPRLPSLRTSMLFSPPPPSLYDFEIKLRVGYRSFPKPKRSEPSPFSAPHLGCPRCAGTLRCSRLIAAVIPRRLTNSVLPRLSGTFATKEDFPHAVPKVMVSLCSFFSLGDAFRFRRVFMVTDAAHATYRRAVRTPRPFPVTR